MLYDADGARGRSMAGALQRLGIRPGDVVGLQVPNRVEGYVSFLGAMLAGAVVLPIAHIYGAPEVGSLLRESGAKALLVPDRWRSCARHSRLTARRPSSFRLGQPATWLGCCPFCGCSSTAGSRF